MYNPDKMKVIRLQAENIIINRMGTTISLTIIHPNSRELLQQAEAMLIDFEKRFSANDPSSDLMKINQHAGIKPIKVDRDLFNLIKIGKNISISSDAIMNVTIGPLVKLWRIGFDDARLPGDEEIKERLQLIDPKNIELDEVEATVYLSKNGMEIDLGALAKGYFADILKDFFLKNGVQAGIIDLGGNVLTIGTSPKQQDGYWRVGIQNPFKSRGNLLAVVAVKDQSVVTSGIYERTLQVGKKAYHHILDSKTGYPIENDVASVTIVSDLSIDGEIWTTLLFAKNTKEGIQWLNQIDGIEGVIVSKNGDVYVSNQLKSHITVVKP